MPSKKISVNSVSYIEFSDKTRHIYSMSNEQDITITDSFVKRLKDVLAAEDNPDQYFRVGIKGGGCAGFEYEEFKFVAAPDEDDHVFSKDGVQVVIDDASLGLLKGSTLDFVEDLDGSRIIIDNPNATSGCGCGTSFSV